MNQILTWFDFPPICMSSHLNVKLVTVDHAYKKFERIVQMSVKKIKIGYQVYDYIEVNELFNDNNESLLGQISYKDKRIHLKKGLADEVWAEVILHEILHGVDFIVLNNLEEKQINQLGIGLAFLLKQNPRFFDLCRKHLYYERKYENVPDDIIARRIHFGAYSYEIVMRNPDEYSGNLEEGTFIDFEVNNNENKFIVYGNFRYSTLIAKLFSLMFHTMNLEFDLDMPRNLFSHFGRNLAEVFKNNRWLVEKLEDVYKKSNKQSRIDFKKYQVIEVDPELMDEEDYSKEIEELKKEKEILIRELAESEIRLAVEWKK
jgi:hypothetical protein